MEPWNTFDNDTRRTSTGNPGAHLVETVGDIADLRLARGILDDCSAVGQRSGHQCCMGAADGYFWENDLAAAKTFFGACNHIAAFDLDFGAEFFQRHDQ